MDSCPVSSVAIVSAMRAEATPVVDALELEPIDGPRHTPFRWYQGRASGLDVVVVVNGVDDRYGADNIGCEPAVLNTWLVVERHRPDVVITAGTAGGFVARGGEVGDVVLSGGSFVFHDRRVSIPGFDRAGIGSYPSADVRGLAERLGAKTGVVTTGSSLEATDEDLARIDAQGALAKDMEAAAVAWACSLSGTPVFALKVIADLVDGPDATAEEFQRNLAEASKRKTEALLAALPILAEEGLG